MITADNITDEQIRRLTTGEGDLDRIAERLIAAANDAGGKDNITVVLARIEPS